MAHPEAASHLAPEDLRPHEDLGRDLDLRRTALDRLHLRRLHRRSAGPRAKDTGTALQEAAVAAAACYPEGGLHPEL